METTQLLPIDFNLVDSTDSEFVQFEDACFLEDFGPWEKDDTVRFLRLDLVDGEVYSVDRVGRKLRGVKVKIVPAT